MDPLFQPARPKGRDSIVREWVEKLPARMQGTLFTCVRGADDVERDDVIKELARKFRGVILYCHDPNPKTFSYPIDYENVTQLISILAEMKVIAKSHDHYPHHYLMHLIHCAEIVGYYHPHPVCKQVWNEFYDRMCHKMHMTPETEYDCRMRLTADEETFAKMQ
jgi:hypothetical protein